MRPSRAGKAAADAHVTASSLSAGLCAAIGNANFPVAVAGLAELLAVHGDLLVNQHQRLAVRVPAESFFFLGGHLKQFFANRFDHPEPEAGARADVLQAGSLGHALDRAHQIDVQILGQHQVIDVAAVADLLLLCVLRAGASMAIHLGKRRMASPTSSVWESSSVMLPAITSASFRLCWSSSAFSVVVPVRISG